MNDLAVLGKIAGLAGIVCGVFLIIFRHAIVKLFDAKLPAKTKARILYTILGMTWSIAICGMLVWMFSDNHSQGTPVSPISSDDTIKTGPVAGPPSGADTPATTIGIQNNIGEAENVVNTNGGDVTINN